MLAWIKNQISYWYFQYELITCIYMFEPWEKRLLNMMTLTILLLVSYSSYTYLPHYMENLWQSILQFMAFVKYQVQEIQTSH